MSTPWCVKLDEDVFILLDNGIEGGVGEGLDVGFGNFGFGRLWLERGVGGDEGRQGVDVTTFGVVDWGFAIAWEPL